MNEQDKAAALQALGEARDLVEQVLVTAPANVERLWALQVRVKLGAAWDAVQATEPAPAPAPAEAVTE